MKKIILVFTLILLLASPVAVFAKQPTDPAPYEKLTLNDPTAIPHNLDELYALIKNSGPGWDKFSDCSHKGLYGSFFQWSMVNDIEAHSIDDHGQSLLILPAADLSKIVAPGGITFPSKGTLKVSEKVLFSTLLHEVLHGNVLVCKQKGDLTIFGSGAQRLFDQLIPFVE
jgi:hypothetical protein